MTQGITPAHAGKRCAALSGGSDHWDHPRTRGEKSDGVATSTGTQGSPPHTRGKVSAVIFTFSRLRITPAHAGKSLLRTKILFMAKDHPRTRGEKLRYLLLPLR